MAVYKKKNIKKLKPERQKIDRNIKMSPKSEKSTVKQKSTVRSGFKVIKGQRGRTNNGFLVLVLIALVLVISYSVFALVHPIGLIEYVSTAYKTIGSGKGFPVNLNVEEMISVSRENNYFYLLNQTELSCYNNSGKSIAKISHGFSKPVLSASETRALIYGQGEKALKVYNFDKEIANIQFENAILSADVCDSGHFAVATYTDSYDSVVKVYNKRGEPVYEWYSANGTVNNVTLTENGKKLLVSTFIADNGSISSKLYLLNYKSADAEYVFNFENDILYSLDTVSANKAIAVFDKNAKIINFKNGSVVDNITEYSHKSVDKYSDRVLLLSTLSANIDKNNIDIYNSSGVKTNSFAPTYQIDDIAIKNNSVFILTDSTIYKTDLDGNILASAEVSFDIKKLVPISDKFVAALSNSTITKIELKEGV